MKPFFITATGTGIGKTLVTCMLTHQLRQRGQKVNTLKPIISGFTKNDPENDTAQIVESLGLPYNTENVNAVSPWRFSNPVSPHIAAPQEGVTLNLNDLINFCSKKNGANSYQLVEGVGGVMVPVNNHATTLDWMQALNWPVILVCGSYLGSISHTLTAIEALKSRNLRLHALIISESENPAPMAMESFVPHATPVLKIPRLSPQQALWSSGPDISWICDA